MKTKNLFLMTALIAGLAFIPAGGVTAQTFTMPLRIISTATELILFPD